MVSTPLCEAWDEALIALALGVLLLAAKEIPGRDGTAFNFCILPCFLPCESSDCTPLLPETAERLSSSLFICVISLTS